MPRGGARRNSGRKQKWEEASVSVGVPKSISNDLIATLEYLWDIGIRGTDLIDALRAAEFRKIKKYEAPVSAGAHSSSIAGGDSIHTHYEEIDLREELIEDPSSTFIVPVTGDSMIGIGIYPGDWLIVESIELHDGKPKDGQIIVVSINDETMVKRYCVEKGKIILKSENLEHPPIKVSEDSISINVSGIVRNAIRRNLSKL